MWLKNTSVTTYQRATGNRNDNPNLFEFGYNTNALSVQRKNLPAVKGNVAGRHSRKQNISDKVDDTPLKARKSKSNKKTLYDLVEQTDKFALRHKIMGGRYHQKYNACKMNRHKVK